MKKLVLGLCLMLMMVLPLSGAFAADSEFVDFNAKLTNSMGLTADEWMQSSLHRALLTILIGMDLHEVNTDYTSQLVSGEPHVMIDNDDFLYILWQNKSNQKVLILYYPENGSASVSVTNNELSMSAWVDILAESLNAKAYANAYDDLATAGELILEAASNK